MGPRNIQVGDPVINLLSDVPVWPVVQKEWIASPVDPASCESLETSPSGLGSDSNTAKVTEGLPAPPIWPVLGSLSRETPRFGSETGFLL